MDSASKTTLSETVNGKTYIAVMDNAEHQSNAALYGGLVQEADSANASKMLLESELFFDRISTRGESRPRVLLFDTSGEGGGISPVADFEVGERGISIYTGEARLLLDVLDWGRWHTRGEE